MSDLNTAIEQLMAAFRERVVGLKEAPVYPEPTASNFPFLVIFPNTGSNNWKLAGHRNDTHNLQIQLHVSLTNLPVDVKQAIGFVEQIPSAVKDAEDAGDLSAISLPMDMNYTFGAMKWASADTIGFTWTLPIRIEQIEQIG